MTIAQKCCFHRRVFVSQQITNAALFKIMRCIIQDNALYMNGEIVQISTGLSGDLLHRLSLEDQRFLHV